MIIKSKRQLEKLVETNLKSFHVTQKYFAKVLRESITKEKSLLKLLEIPLIRYLAISPRSIDNFEKHISAKFISAQGSPLSRMKSNLDEYYAVLAEIQAARILKKRGMKNIKFLSPKSNPDIEFKENGITKYAEVKDLMNLNPEFSIIHNKFWAKSLVNRHFKKDFILSCTYATFRFDSVISLHNAISSATDKLIKKLTPLLKRGEIDDLKIEFDGFQFKINARTTRSVDFLLVFSGGGGFFGGPEDVFLNLTTVYTRFITEFKVGYQQLLRKRGGDKELVKSDYFFIFLNIEKYRFVDRKIKGIFRQMARTLGMSRLVRLRIIL